MQNINVQSAQIQAWDNRRRTKSATPVAVAPVAKVNTTAEQSQYLHEPVHVGEWIQANGETYAAKSPSSLNLQAVPLSSRKAILAYNSSSQGKIPPGRVLNLRA